MCVENVYVDRYPDGREVEFRQLSICQYGQPSRPCRTLTTLENPPRNIRYGEPTSQTMLTSPHFVTVPHTPPRSPHRRSGSLHRHSGEYTSDEGHRRPRRDSGLAAAALLNGKKLRQHRKERIVIVDSPPTPRTPPQLFNQVFTAPSSPATPPYIFDAQVGRGCPIIVDERKSRAQRAPSVGAVVGERIQPRRTRSQSQPRVRSSDLMLPSFSERVRRREEEERGREERRRRRNEREEREAERELERRRAERIAQQNEEILKRPAVPMPPLRRLSQRAHLRPVVDQTRVLQAAMGGLSLEERATEAAERRRREDREALIRTRFEAERQADEEEAMRQRLRDRQMLPQRRFSVGPGHRRHRVLYDDGVYRYE